MVEHGKTVFKGPGTPNMLPIFVFFITIPNLHVSF